MPYPIQLSGLSEREQIIDVVLRGVLSFDENDRDLFNSCFPTSESDKETVYAEFAGIKYNGMKELTEKCFNQVAPMVTFHQTSNFRVDYKEGATTAKVFCNAVSNHFRPGECFTPGAENFLGAGVYDIEVMKEADGQWKVKTWVMRARYVQGNPGIMPGRS